MNKELSTMTESRIEKLTRIGQEMAAAVAEMRADAGDVTSQNPETAALVEELSVTCDRWSQWEEVAAVALTHLQSTGRLIAAGGMALTAEQVEDVRTVMNNSPMEIYDATERGRYYAAAARLRALFPATEPAEATINSTLNVPAPAEPAEEETKAEEKLVAHRDSKGDIYVGHALVAFKHRSYEQIRRWFNEAHPGGISERRYRAVLHLLNVEASSPVVPTSTETEWQTLDAVPAEVRTVWDKSGTEWRRRKNGGWKWGLSTGGWSKVARPSDFVEYAPFVAAEER